MILQILMLFISVAYSQSQFQNPANSSYSECERAFGKFLEYCGKKSSIITDEACLKNITDCTTKCGTITGVSFAVARAHTTQCSQYIKNSPAQDAVINALEKNKRQNELDEVQRTNQGPGGRILNGVGGTLSTTETKTGIEIKEIKGSFSVPINVPKTSSPPASQ